MTEREVAELVARRRAGACRCADCLVIRHLAGELDRLRAAELARVG